MDAPSFRAQLALLAAGVRDCVLADSPAACAAAAAAAPARLGAGVGALRWDAHGNVFLVRLGALAARLRADEARLAAGERVVVPVRAHAAARRPAVLAGDALHAWLQRLAHCVRGLSIVLQTALAAGGPAEDAFAGPAVDAAGRDVPPSARLAMPDDLPLCPVALTGYLLGYPVVYDVSDGAAGNEPGANCLGGCTLRLHSAEWRGSPPAAMAFSVPTERDADGAYAPVADAVAQWASRLRRDAERTGLPVATAAREVTLGHVAL